jgi:murein L,D-transpeptidase YcbB/YkuD
MRMTVLLISVVLIFGSCKKNSAKHTIIGEMHALTPHQQEQIDSIPVEFNGKINWKLASTLDKGEWLKDLFDKNEELVIDSLPLFSKNLLPRLYQYNKYNIIWNSEKNIEDAYRAIELAWLDGLRPEDYHLAKLKSLQQKIIGAKTSQERAEWLGRHDVILTDAFILLSFHLLSGKLDPNTLDNNWNYDQRHLSKNTILMLFDYLKKEKLLDGLDQLRPADNSYRAMMSALLYYHDLKESDWQVISGFEKLELGDTSKVITQIRKRLTLCCQLNSVVADSMVFDSVLMKDIRHFQQQHGLDDDGTIGKQTMEILNLTPKQRIEKLKVNLERLRWMPPSKEDYVVEVNIAAFKLYVKKEGELIHECKVMTGLPYHKTPIFTEKMKYIDINPTWTVPYSIATKEILPSLKKQGAGYLKRNNMSLLNSAGKEINAYNVKFSKLSRSNFPYTIRQNPGPDNALGVVKFMFPNQYSVYLHDTQSKALFSRSSRAFSHGCIRVENPLELAEILLDDKKEWDRAKIEEVIATQKLTRVNLKKDVQVRILYYTAGLFSDGTLFYLPDIYKRDAAMADQLEKPFTYDKNTFKRVYPNQDSITLDTVIRF